jgi:hypothetical protein
MSPSCFQPPQDVEPVADESGKAQQSVSELGGTGTNMEEGQKEIHRNFNVPRGLPILAVGDPGPAPLARSSGKTLVPPSGAAEYAAIDAELATIIDAWRWIAPHSRSIILGMSRKAAAKAARQEP